MNLYTRELSKIYLKAKISEIYLKEKLSENYLKATKRNLFESEKSDIN